MSTSNMLTTSPKVQFIDVSKRYGSTVALDRVSTTLNPGLVYGLFGRNGAGKTTLMSILDAQSFPTGGSVRVGGVNPAGSPRTLEQICFIRENQKYPDEATCPSVLRTASWFFPNWSKELSDQLMETFELPQKTTIKKLSRGQSSALAATVGLASRASITVFDEPYLGLDASARELFYKNLLAELEQSPRTILISSHLIDEIATIIDHVLLLERGQLVLDESTDSLLERAHTITGPTSIVEDFCQNLEVLKTESLGGISRYEALGELSSAQRSSAKSLGLEIAPLQLQSLATAVAARSSAAVKGASK